jgi:NADPH:quinone reductase-like Zn-dependent oxidoreductase
MKALVFARTGGPEVLALADGPRPDVPPGMVLLKVLCRARPRPRPRW